MKVLTVISILVVILVLLLITMILIYKAEPISNQEYYPAKIFPYLIHISSKRKDILKEVAKISQQTNVKHWNDWPEKYLYHQGGGWKVFPFNVFGTWIPENCKECPVLYKFLKGIKGLRMAGLSRLRPGVSLDLHEGYGKYSNDIFRCHYGIDVPDNCSLMVGDKVKFHRNDEWIIFDDSKPHTAANYGNRDRIVLLLDIERPSNIEKGKSTAAYSKEILELMNMVKNVKTKETVKTV